MANALLYGFQTLSEDLLNRRAAEIPEVKAAIEISLEAHNAAINQVVGVFAERTQDYQGRFRSNAAGILQPLDEFGRSTPMKYSDYTVAWPLKMAGGATGFTWLVRPKMLVSEINDILSQLFIADYRWNYRQMLGAIFDNTAAGRTWLDDVFGSITLRGLANGDAAPLYYKQSSDTSATDDHYSAEQDAIADNANPYLNFKGELSEHPENSGDVVALIPTGLKATTIALTEFEPVVDPNFTPGTGEGRVNGFPQLIPPNADPLGYLKTSQVFVAEWPMLPAGYIIYYSVGGPRPLKMREDELAEFRGFFPKDRNDQFPYVGEQWVRRAGFAGNNRVGAGVHRVGTSDSYTIPTGYSLLMAS